MKKKIIITLAILAILTGGGFGGFKWLKAKNDPNNMEPVFATSPVTVGDLEVTVEGWGPLLPTEEQEINSAASGNIKGITVKAGDRVKKGQDLITLENRTLAMEIQQKQLELDQKKSKLAKKLNTTIDKIDHASAEQVLGITAPADGRLVEFTKKEKEEVNSGTVIGKVVDDSGIIIEVPVASQVYDNIKKGDTVQLYFSEFGSQMNADIYEIDSNPNPGDKGFTYKVSILINNPGLLKVGMKPQVIFNLPGIAVQQEGEITGYKSEENIVSGVSGALATVKGKNGDWVKKGQVLASVEEGDVVMDIISERLQIKSLEFDLENKMDELKNMVVKAPIDGIVMEVFVHEGNQISTGTKVMKIANYDKMKAKILIDEYDIAKVEKDQEAIVTVDGLAGEKFSAIVQEVALMGETREGLAGFPVIVDIPAPEGLRGGMNAKVAIHIASKENVLLVPIEALYEEVGKNLVQVMEGDTPVAKEIEVGLTNDQFAEVISGIEEGMMVVVGNSMDMMGGFGPGGFNGGHSDEYIEEVPMDEEVEVIVE